MYLHADIPFKETLEVVGQSSDLELLYQDPWLMDTEVQYNLHYQKGMWHLTMIFIAIENPFKLICRKIDTYASKKKATIYASILQRGIRKDARGTLKTNQNAFNICDN